MSSAPALASSLRENEQLIADLSRYAEGVLTESQVRRKWRLEDEVWELFGTDDSYVERVELERVRRIRSGAAKKEKAQLHVVAAPDVLNGILMDPRASAKHRIDSAKALDDLAGFAPQAAGEQEMVSITINLGEGEVYRYGGPVKPIPANDGWRDGGGIDAVPQERPLIEADNQVDQQEAPPVKRGRGRPRGSKNKPKAPKLEPESRPQGVLGFKF